MSTERMATRQEMAVELAQLQSAVDSQGAQLMLAARTIAELSATIAELEAVIGETHVVLAAVADDAGRATDLKVVNALTNLVTGKLVHKDVLPFEAAKKK